MLYAAVVVVRKRDAMLSTNSNMLNFYLITYYSPCEGSIVFILYQDIPQL